MFSIFILSNTFSEHRKMFFQKKLEDRCLAENSMIENATF